MASGRLLPYPKPITVKPGSFAVLSDIGPDACPAPGSRPWAGQEWQVAVGEGTGRAIGTPCVPGFVIVPRHDAGAETTLTPLSDTQAFFALAVNAVNLVAHGSAGTRALGRLAQECRCFSLTFSDLDEACRLVLELVAAETAGVRPPRRRREGPAVRPEPVGPGGPKGPRGPCAGKVPPRWNWTTTWPSTTTSASS